MVTVTQWYLLTEVDCSCMSVASRVTHDLVCQTPDSPRTPDPGGKLRDRLFLPVTSSRSRARGRRRK